MFSDTALRKLYAESDVPREMTQGCVKSRCRVYRNYFGCRLRLTLYEKSTNLDDLDNTGNAEELFETCVKIEMNELSMLSHPVQKES